MYTDKDPRLRELTDDDVLLGRGFPAIENEGNVRFRELVRSRSAEYHAAYRRHTKDSIARDVVNTINRRGGRFLTQLDDAANIKGLVIPAAARVWTEADEAAVLIKAKQALRDHSDESKEGGRSFSRRRPAAGSGNMVLEWIVPSPSQQRQQQQHQQAAAGGAMPTASSSSSHVAAPNTLQQFNASSIFPSPTTHHLWFLNPERVGSALNMAGHPGGGVAGGHDATGLFAATARQQQNMYLSAGQQQPEYTPANLQFALGQLLHNQTQQQQQQQTGGGISSIPAGFAGLLQNTAATTTAPGSLVSFQGMFASQQQQQQRPSPVATVSDQGLSSSQHALSSNSSISRTAPGAAPPQQTTARGTRSSAAIHRAIENAAGSTASAAPREGSIPLCDLEVKLLIVLCSFGLPTWTKESRESAFASTTDTSVTTSREEGSLPFGWSDVGKHLLTACQSSTTGDCGSATGTVTRLLTELDTLARMAIALVGRCVDCVQGGEGLTASLTQQRDVDVVQHALTQWSLALGDCIALDGTRLGGTIPEALPNDPSSAAGEGVEEGKRAGPTSPRPSVAAVISTVEAKTIVQTLATLVQLRWIFHHPTPTIFSLLSSQEGDTSRDYLLLKGVLKHGLVNELDFRIQQGSSLTRSQVEDRIYLLTKLLYPSLRDVQQKEALTSLQRKYTALMF